MLWRCARRDSSAHPRCETFTEAHKECARDWVNLEVVKLQEEVKWCGDEKHIEAVFVFFNV